jgi:hypothetical protein
MGLSPPEYQTASVCTASVSPEIIDKVEFLAPACSPPVALVAPTGDEETVSNETMGVVISGTYGPHPYGQYPGIPRPPAWPMAIAERITTNIAIVNVRMPTSPEKGPHRFNAVGLPVPDLRGLTAIRGFYGCVFLHE